jgi:GMP synthase (glutamine-hydrolysing)
VKTAIAVRHIHFEGLGSLEEVLIRDGYKVQYLDIGEPAFEKLNPADAELLIVLGGPVGVYEEAEYPFLAGERDLLAKRMQLNLPTLGICLGAQLMAAALGAKVYPSGIKEIGFAPVDLTDTGLQSSLLHLKDQPVLHWHGDTFDLPQNSQLLASTAACRNQAFSLGPNILGLQFHPELSSAADLEKWLVGYAVELAAAKVSPIKLREDSQRYCENLRNAAIATFTAWINGLSL